MCLTPVNPMLPKSPSSV